MEIAFITENIAALSVWDDCTDRLQLPHPQNLLGNIQSNVVLLYFGLFLFSFDAGHLVVVDSRDNVKCGGETHIIISGIQHACKDLKWYGLCFPDHSYIWCVLVCCSVVTTC